MAVIAWLKWFESCGVITTLGGISKGWLERFYINLIRIIYE
jgi:hypothetical protein